MRYFGHSLSWWTLWMDTHESPLHILLMAQRWASPHSRWVIALFIRVRVLCGLMLNSRKTSSSEMSSRREIIISWRQLLGRFCTARPMTIITYHAIVSNNLVLLRDTFLVTWCSPPESVRAKLRFYHRSGITFECILCSQPYRVSESAKLDSFYDNGRTIHWLVIVMAWLDRGRYSGSAVSFAVPSACLWAFTIENQL